MAIVDSFVALLENYVITMKIGLIGFIPKLILALIVLLVGRWVARKSVKLAGVWVAKTVKRPSVIGVTLTLLKYSIYVLTILAVLDVLGVSATPLLLGAGIASVMIGILIAPVITSYLSGIFILSDRPYEVGDRIEIIGLKLVGYVEDINFRTTKIRTTQNNLIVIPNSNMLNKEIINYTSEDKRRRIDLPVQISYDSDLEKAKEIMVNTALKTRGVIKKGTSKLGGFVKPLEPRVLLKSFGDNGINLELRFWIENADRKTIIESSVNEKIFSGFNKSGIVIPFPQRDVHMIK